MKSWQSDRGSVAERNIAAKSPPYAIVTSSDWGQVVNRYYLLQFVPSESGLSEIC
jgi:hypothetical protein